MYKEYIYNIYTKYTIYIYIYMYIYIYILYIFYIYYIYILYTFNIYSIYIQYIFNTCTFDWQQYSYLSTRFSLYLMKLHRVWFRTNSKHLTTFGPFIWKDNECTGLLYLGNKETKMLDVGCGTGLAAKHVSHHYLFATLVKIFSFVQNDFVRIKQVEPLNTMLDNFLWVLCYPKYLVTLKA